MTSLLTFINLVLSLISEAVKRFKESEREDKESKIKENPREFFEQGNRAKLEDHASGVQGNTDNSDDSPNGVSDNTKH